MAEVNLDPIQKKVDSNDNEAAPEFTEVEAVETSTAVLPSVPVENSFDTLSNLGQDIFEENTDLVKKSEETSSEFEVKLREKKRSSIKKKVESKLADNLLTKEETISEELQLLRMNLDLGLNTMQDDDDLEEGAYHHYYWGEEREIIFKDD